MLKLQVLINMLSVNSIHFHNKPINLLKYCRNIMHLDRYRDLQRGWEVKLNV